MKGQGDFVMKYLPKFVLGCSLFALMPVVVHAAGTYYNGATYRSPQSAYSTQTYAQRANNNSGYARNTYSSYYSSTAVRPNANARVNVGQSATTTTRQAQQVTNTSNAKSGRNGFWLDAGITHEMAQWQFEMKESASILHYDNIGWNVFDAKAGYAFDMGKLRGQIDAGFKYGMQSGESSMIDDDVTNGGYLVTSWCEDVDENGKCIGFIGDQIGHALSVGKSDGGSMLGFNVGFGLTDAWQWGKVRFTPSIGYRYLKYKLETKNNYGVSVDSAACYEDGVSGEIQCDPAIILHYTVTVDGKPADLNWILWEPTDTNQDGFWDVELYDEKTGSVYFPDGVNAAGTYFFQQPGVSHSYEVEWSGPYLALDMDYMINANNAVNGRVEVGLPGYKATGDQPYRFDWAHPKSVEDKAGMFGAFHLGIGANWLTAITNTVSLSVGLTYDYYSVSDADATTYLNEGYYMGAYNTLYNEYFDYIQKIDYPNYDQLTGADLENASDAITQKTDAAMLQDPTAQSIKKVEADCPGWVCKTDGEIESFYKSIGIRVGINARF